VHKSKHAVRHRILGTNVSLSMVAGRFSNKKQNTTADLVTARLVLIQQGRKTQHRMCFDFMYAPPLHPRMMLLWGNYDSKQHCDASAAAAAAAADVEQATLAAAAAAVGGRVSGARLARTEEPTAAAADTMPGAVCPKRISRVARLSGKTGQKGTCSGNPHETF
jgi:hypothetical protein